MPKRLSSIMQWLFLSIVLVFLCLRLWTDFRNLPHFAWDFEFSKLASATLLAILCYLLMALLWAWMARSGGSRISILRLVSVWFDSMMAKYVPGGFWNIVGRVYLCYKGEYLDQRLALSSVVLEQALSLSSQVILVLLLSPLYLQTLKYPVPLALGFSLAAIVLYILYVRLVVLTSSYLQARWNIPTPFLNHRPSDIRRWLLLYLLASISTGGAFFQFIGSLYSLPLSFLPVVIISLNAAFLVGFLLPLAPAGLGVREAVLVFLLSPWIPSSAVIALSIVSRIWAVLIELFCVASTRFLVYISEDA